MAKLVTSSSSFGSTKNGISLVFASFGIFLIVVALLLPPFVAYRGRLVMDGNLETCYGWCGAVGPLGTKVESAYGNTTGPTHVAISIRASLPVHLAVRIDGPSASVADIGEGTHFSYAFDVYKGNWSIAVANPSPTYEAIYALNVTVGPPEGYPVPYLADNAVGMLIVLLAAGAFLVVGIRLREPKAVGEGWSLSLNGLTLLPPLLLAIDGGITFASLHLFWLKETNEFVMTAYSVGWWAFLLLYLSAFIMVLTFSAFLRFITNRYPSDSGTAQLSTVAYLAFAWIQITVLANDSLTAVVSMAYDAFPQVDVLLVSGVVALVPAALLAWLLGIGRRDQN